MVLVTGIFLAGYLTLIYYYYYHWVHLKTVKPVAISTYPFVSVIIAARNEERSLPRLLKAIQQQTYPPHYFEVLIIDDYSTDATASVIQPFLTEQFQLLQPALPKEVSSKKKAIETGVTAAKGELMIITDADCIPTREWLETIVAFYRQQQVVFIAAPVKFQHNQSVLQLFEAMDFMVLQGITAASVAANFHSMCNGANLAYTKEAFTAVNGFEGIDTVSSGDDMLLMYKIWKKYPQQVGYLKNDRAIVSTAPMKTWKDFIMQRRRWASKTLHYDDYRVMGVLAFVYLFNLLFFVLLVATFYHAYNSWLLLVYLVSKTIIEFPFVYSVSKFYKERKLMLFFPLFQPLHILYTVSIGLLSQFGKYEWKGRKTK